MPRYPRKKYTPKRKSWVGKRRSAARSTAVRRKSVKRKTSRRTYAAKRRRTVRISRPFPRAASRVKSAIVKPGQYKFSMTWLDNHNFASDPAAPYNMKVVPGALFSPRQKPNFMIQALDQVSGGSDEKTNAQPAGYDVWDALYSAASVYKSYMEVTIYSEVSQPLVVAYCTKTGARIGEMESDSGVTPGTIDYVSNIQWGRDATSLVNQADFLAGPSFFDTLVSGTSNGYSSVEGDGTRTYTEHMNNAGHPTRLMNVNKMKKFIWNQNENTINRTKKVKFSVDHTKYVKNWKNRQFEYKKGSTATDNDAGGVASSTSSNSTLLGCYPTLSPVNYLHIGCLLPVNSDMESAADATGTSAWYNATTGNNTLASDQDGALKVQPVAAIAQSNLSGILRIQCKLVMYANLKRPAQELIDDGDALNATSSAMTIV